MELLLRVEVAETGRTSDVRVALHPTHRVKDLADALGRFCQIRTPGRLSLREQQDGDTIWLPTETPVDSIGLVSGDTVVLGRAKRSGVATPTPGQICLAVVAGVDLGSRLALVPGSHRVGRHQDCALRLRDPKVSRSDFTITVDKQMVLDPGTTRTNSLRHNGRAITRPVVITEGDTIHVGATTFAIERRRRPTDRRRDYFGAVPFHRTPEFRRPVDEVVLPPLGDLPSVPDPRRFQVLAVLAPLISAVAMASIFGSMRFLVLALISPVVAIANHVDSRRSGQHDHAARLRDLEERVRAREHELELALAEERERRESLAPYGHDLVERTERLDPSLWGRRRGSDAFLSLRLGTGRLEAGVQVAPETDGDQQLRRKIAKRFERLDHLDTSPITVELGELATIALVGDDQDIADLCCGLTVQAACLHSPEDLVIAAAAHPRASTADWLKWLPHVRSTNSPIAGRHLATDRAEADELLQSIVQIAEQRVDVGPNGIDRRWPWILLTVDLALNPDPGLLSRLLDLSPRAGISTICLTSNHALIPRQAVAVVDVPPGRSSATCLIRHVDPDRQTLRFSPDAIGPAVALQAALRLAPLIDVTAANAIAAVPKTVTLLEAYGRTTIDDDWIATEWLKDRGHTLPTIVGLTDTGPVLLDLVKHGPHGLIAGTSGSGKSELVQSLVAGLIALNSPERINILFIDYKGGALSSRFASAPHTVGAVTNLDAMLSLRALTSLKAELDRRMRLFSELGVNDLREALLRYPAQAPPSLVIVIDEFASLVRELPEFVDGIVSIAERGRSLGIHLLLSTQRPSGSINESIQQNVNLRISLRMLDATESMNVIGTADAAMIPTHMRGRAIARLGPGDLVAFQSAWSGAPSTTLRSVQPVAVVAFGGTDPRSDMLRTTASEPDEAGPSAGSVQAQQPTETQLDGLLSTIAKTCSDLGMKAGPRPWRDTLPLIVPLGSLAAVTEGGESGHGTPQVTRLAIGMVDEPEEQSQDPLVLDMAAGGGFVVYGSAGSGKTTALITTAAAAAVADDDAGGGNLTVVGLDFASRQLRALEVLPQCGMVANGDDVEAVTRLIAVLDREFRRRQALMAAANGSPTTDRPPTVLLVIDGFDNMIETFNATGSVAAMAEWSEMVSNLIDRGREVGILPVISTGSTSGRSGRLMNLIDNRVTLRQVDDSVYRAFGLPGKLATGLHLEPGQGLTSNGRSMQIACLTSTGADGVPDNGAIVDLADRLRGSVQPALLSDPLPASIGCDTPQGTDPFRVHIGRQDLTATDATVDLIVGGLCVIGPPRSGKSTTLASVAAQLVDRGHEVYVIGGVGSPLRASVGWTGCAFGRSDDVADTLEGLRVAVEQFPDVSRVLVVDDLQRFDDMTLNPALKEIVDRGVVCVASVDHSRNLLGTNPLMKEMRSTRNTLILRAEDEAAIQTVAGARFRLRPGLDMPAGRGVLATDCTIAVVQVAGEPVGRNDCNRSNRLPSPGI